MENIEKAIEYFSVFGGLDIKIDTKQPLFDLIEKHILDKYRYLRNDVANLVGNDELYSSILTGAALGDRRTNSSFKRAKISFDDGIDCIDALCDAKAVKLESSYGGDDVSEKILFTAPFLRFWFAFVSPIFKGIKDGNYVEFFEKFSNIKAEFESLIFEQLSHEYIKLYFQDEKIYNINRYWDDFREINIIAKTKSSKMIAGICKYTNQKVKKTLLTKLELDCKEIGLSPDVFVIFAKNGFTSELKSMKNQNLRIFSARNFKVFLED